MPGQGIIHGIKRPIVHGIKHNGSPFNSPMVGVTRDATSGIYVPSTAGEWTTTMVAAGLGTGNPSSAWTFQMAGNAPDVIGSLNLTAGGTGLAYQQAVAGWTRLGVTMTEAGTGHFTVTAGVGPDPSAVSSLWLGYIDFLGTPAALRNVVSAGGGTLVLEAGTKITAGPLLSTKCLTISVNGAVNPVPGGAIPVVLKYDRTHSAIVTYSSVEKIVGTYAGTVTDGNKGFGATQGTGCAMATIYGCLFTGSAAELTDAQIKVLLQTLGWTISWT